MNKKFKALAIGAILGLGIVGLMGAATSVNQTVTMGVNSMCVLAVTGNPGALTVTAPAIGGATPSNPTDNTTYAQYTSTVATGTTRRLTAQWGGADAAPSGCALRLTAAPQGGNRGVTAGQITLSSTAASIVTGIRSCATGTLATNGAQLAYALAVTDVESLVSGQSRTATITLTLTDAS
jgi:hypothetical protein